MHALVEEHARGPVELGNDDALRSVDDEGAGRRHVRDVAQIHVLDPRVEVFVLGIGAGKAEFRLQGDVVGKAPLKAFLDRILGRIDEVIDKAEFVVVPRVLDRENFLEYLEQTLVAAAFGRGLELEGWTSRRSGYSRILDVAKLTRLFWVLFDICASFAWGRKN